MTDKHDFDHPKPNHAGQVAHGDNGDTPPSILDRGGPNGNTRPCQRASVRIPVENGQFLYRPVNCRSRLCPTCAPRIAARHATDLEVAIARYDLTLFLTLTVAPAATQTASLLALQRAWKHFGVYYPREHGFRMSYIRVLQVGDSGHPHFHLLTRPNMHDGWLAGAWTSAGGVPPWRGPVRNRQRTSKYLLGEVAVRPVLALPPRTKLLTRSRDILFPRRQRGTQSRVIFAPIGRIRASAGAHFIRETEDGFVADTDSLDS